MITTRGPRRLHRTAALVASGMLALAGVGACSAENIAERAIEAGTGGEADVEIDGDGGVTIESSEGSVTVDPDAGEVVVEGSDGGTTYQGLTGELPDGFPSQVPLVKGTIVFGQSTTEASGAASYSVIIESSIPVSDVYQDAKSALTGAGFEVSNETVGSSGDTAFAGGTFTGAGWTVTLSVGTADASSSTVSYSVAPTS